MGRGLKSGTILALFLLGAIWGSSEAWAGDFRPWWDFRQWGMVAAPPERARIYLDYMDQFQRQGITVLMLNNPKSLPPFTPERRFLADAAKRGIKVWLRTNRVSPKGGIPGVPNTTLDFALNPDIQKQTLDYLLAMAKLSTEFPNVVGLIIGGEEWVGARVDKQALARHQAAGEKELGFNITGSLSEAEKIQYFDWLQKIQNRWYEKIWDTLKERYPKLELFIYPSTIAVCGERWSSFPRASYWDIYDLIVTRNRAFSVMLGACTTEDPLGLYQTEAWGNYLRAATKGRVPFYLLLQSNRCGPKMKTPSPQELEADVLAAVAGGARGAGYWPVDMDTKKDIYETDKVRWQAMFAALAKGVQVYPDTRKGSGLYVVKPRYSQYWQPDNAQSIRTLAGLLRAGMAPDFLLVEQVLAEPLPANAKIFYLPETYKYEKPQVLEKLLAAKKPIFFSLNPAEPQTPDKKPQTPLYGLLGLKKGPPSKLPSLQRVKVSWGDRTYEVDLDLPSPPPRPAGRHQRNWPRRFSRWRWTVKKRRFPWLLATASWFSWPPRTTCC